MAKHINTKPDYAGHLVLVAWSRDDAPALAKALGVNPAPPKWDPDAFDRLWVITYGPGGKVNFQDLPQRLLYGDSDK